MRGKVQLNWYLISASTSQKSNPFQSIIFILSLWSFPKIVSEPHRLSCGHHFLKRGESDLFDSGLWRCLLWPSLIFSFHSFWSFLMRKALSNVNSLKAVQSLKNYLHSFFCIKLGDRLKFICTKRVSVQAIFLEKNIRPSRPLCLFWCLQKKLQTSLQMWFSVPFFGRLTLPIFYKSVNCSLNWVFQIVFIPLQDFWTRRQSI